MIINNDFLDDLKLLVTMLKFVCESFIITLPTFNVESQIGTLKIGDSFWKASFFRFQHFQPLILGVCHSQKMNHIISRCQNLPNLEPGISFEISFFVLCA